MSAIDDLLARVEALDAAATPGPWEALGFTVLFSNRESAEVSGRGDQPDRDAEWIAESRTLVPALAQALREARHEVHKAFMPLEMTPTRVAILERLGLEADANVQRSLATRDDTQVERGEP